jgi:hypothetical protein
MTKKVRQMRAAWCVGHVNVFNKKGHKKYPHCASIAGPPALDSGALTIETCANAVASGVRTSEVSLCCVLTHVLFH